MTNRSDTKSSCHFYALCFYAVVYMCLTTLLWLLRVMLNITYNCFYFSMFFFIYVLVSLSLCIWSVVLCIFLYVPCLSSVLFYCNFYGPCVWNKRWWWLQTYKKTTMAKIYTNNKVHEVLHLQKFPISYTLFLIRFFAAFIICCISSFALRRLSSFLRLNPVRNSLQQNN